MKFKRMYAMLLALVLCLGLYPMTAVADTGDTLPEIVWWEDFSQAQATGTINKSGSDRKIATQNGMFVPTSTGTTYSFANGTLDYTAKVSGDYLDVRFSRGSVMEKNLMQDFVLSFKLKPDTDTLSAQFSFSGRYEHSASLDSSKNGFQIKSGKFYVGNTAADTTATIPANQWSLIEIAFHYNEDVMPTNPVLGKGAIDSYTVMLNGEALYTVNLSYYIKSYDFFRMFRYTGGATFELDDLRVALGNRSLKDFDEAGGVKADDYTQNFSWFDQPENPATDYAYSFCVVGDTQILNMDDYKSRTPSDADYGNYDAPTNYMATLYDWIVANADSKKMAQVIGLGDITDDNTDLEWSIAKEQIGKLDGVIPYSLVRGNHDPGDEYNATFASNTAYTQQFEGFFEAGKLENSYKRFEVAGHKYLLFTFDFGPTDDVLEWANAIIESYSDHKVIITTHAYLSEDGDTQSSATDTDLPSKDGNEQKNDGDEMWEKLVSKHENIFLVLSGHVDADYLVCTQSVGEKGNTVTQLLVDPQGLDEEVGSTSMVTMLYFSEDGQTVTVETYSTVREQYFAEENQFTIQVTNEELNEIYSNDFNSCATPDIPTTVGGTVVLGAENCGHTVADGALNVTKTASGYVSLRVYQGNASYKNSGATPIKGDVVLSFDIKPINTANLGALYCGNDEQGLNALHFMSVANGQLSGYGKSADLTLNQWNAVKVVFNYDHENGKFTSYTVMLNGMELHTQKIASDITLNSINSFILFRWSAADVSFSLDNLYYGFGRGGRGTGETTDIWSVDFEGVTEVPTDENRLNNLRVMNHYLPANGATKTKVANGILTLVDGGGQAFVDVNPDSSFGYVGDMTLSMQIRPVGTSWHGGNFVSIDHAGGSFVPVTMANQNQLKINEKTVTLSSYRFSTVDIAFRYDYAKMIYTTVTLYVNGTVIGTLDISAQNCAVIRWFRTFYCWTANNGFDVDAIYVVKNCQSLYKGETSVTEFIGYQTTAVENNAFNLRLISILTDADLSKYDYVGYDVTASYQVNGETVTMVLPDEIGQCKKVFTSVLATDEMAVADVITAETLGGQYIFAINCIGVPADCGEIQFSVTTYYKLSGQDEISERGFTFTVDPATDANQGGVN